MAFLIIWCLELSHIILPLLASAGDPAVGDLNQTLPNLTADSEKSFTRVKSYMGLAIEIIHHVPRSMNKLCRKG
jgi:hypothetical protein